MENAKVSLIFAAGIDHSIGKNNQLLWNLPEDLRRFKQLTTGNVIVMGRKTFESIGRPLPNRENVIITRNPDFKAPNGCVVFHSIEDALEAYREKDIFIIGGSEIYKQTYKYATNIYYTMVLQRYPDADAHIDPEDFEEDFELAKMSRLTSENGLECIFYDLKRCQEKR